MDELIKSNVIKIKRFVTSRFLLGAVLVVCIFNLLATRILPKDIFLVYASNINVSELVNYTNAERSARNLGTLTVDSRLVSAAYAKGQDMLEKDYWAHYGPNGESPWIFISQAGYSYVYAGENLAKDFSSAAPIHSAWMASPTHRDNIINVNYTNIGIAAVTGDFQGQETTIVVQMFGSLELQQSVLPAESQLPTTGDEDLFDNPSLKLEPPTLTSPTDGEILMDAAFTVRGVSEKAREVRIYDSSDRKGDADVKDDDNFEFITTEPYDEGKHILSAKALRDGKVASDSSNKVIITVDTIAPSFIVDSAEVEYYEINDLGRKYHFLIEVQDNPSEVKGKYDDDVIIFALVDESWKASLLIDPANLHSLYLSALDKAGNSTETEFSASELEELLQKLGPDLSGDLSVKSQKWFLDDIWERIFTRTLRGQVNFFITLIMIIILIVEQIMLAKTGLTKGASNNYLHIPVFIVLLFASLLGGGGEIL
ncbi:MAG: CAP domain-containing protein [Patescibacteria group bacterium]|nr:CAP domain-containing protein [Patescibacteria group bacterium]